jgi:hypothetical protein
MAALAGRAGHWLVVAARWIAEDVRFFTVRAIANYMRHLY